MTKHIRSEVKKEMEELNFGQTSNENSLAEKMEVYLQSEVLIVITVEKKLFILIRSQNQLASTHTCKICFELMQSPENTPYLLFPCGHTFCKQCLEKHCRGGNSRNKTCPYCRIPIESKAVNQALKDLIEQFVTQKKMVKFK